MRILDLGLIKYEDFIDKQAFVLNERLDGREGDTLIVAEHPPVVTLGKIDSSHNSLDLDYFNKNAIPVLSTARGGKNTYHGPGQIVLYPIIDLSKKVKDVSLYIDLLERTVAEGLGSLGIDASRVNGKRGVWVKSEKIAFIGVAFKKWITYYGVSVNLNNDIVPFEKMDPCGMKGVRVTSAKKILGHNIDIDRAKKVLIDGFIRGFDVEYGGAEKMVTQGVL